MKYISECEKNLTLFCKDKSIQKSTLIDTINNKTEMLLKKHKKIILCGLTPMAKYYSKILSNKNYEITFLDHTEKEKYIDGLYVDSYENINKYKDHLFVICSRTIFGEHIKLIPEDFQVLSYHNLLLLDKSFNFKNFDFSQEKMIQQISDIIDNSERYIEILNKLEDEISKELLSRIILFRLNFDAKLVTGVGSKYIHYFDQDVITLTDEERFVDAGGYIGDTLETFIKLTDEKFGEYHLFEPEKDLIDKAKKVTLDVRVSFHNLGLYSEKTTKTFACGNEGSGKICNEGEIEINLDKLDDILEIPVSFIKMDIEGAELEALKGAKKTIETNKPKLAICVYHKYEDIRVIFNFIEACCNGRYKIYIRAEKDNLDQQIVMYAI